MNKQSEGSVAFSNATNRRTTNSGWAVESMVLFNAYGLIGWIPT